MTAHIITTKNLVSLTVYNLTLLVHYVVVIEVIALNGLEGRDGRRGVHAPGENLEKTRALNRERGITFLISSHILTELSLIATKYGIISKGKLIQQITAEQLRKACTKTVHIQADDPQKLMEVVKATVDNPCEIAADGVKIQGETDLTALLSAILAQGLKILNIHCGATTFEDYYLSVIGGDRQ